MTRSSIYAVYNERSERAINQSRVSMYAGASRVFNTAAKSMQAKPKSDPPSRALRPSKVFNTLPANTIKLPTKEIKTTIDITIEIEKPDIRIQSKFSRAENGMNAFFTRQATGKTPMKPAREIVNFSIETTPPITHYNRIPSTQSRIPEVILQKRNLLPDPFELLGITSTESKEYLIKSELEKLMDLEALLLNEIALAE